MFIDHHFKAPWWLRNAHLQTITAKWLRRNAYLASIKQVVELPDNDFIELAWTEKPKSNNHKPIIVLLHGLAGSIDSHYIKGMLAAIKQKGWIGVLMHFRGCGEQKNRQGRSYHSGATEDIDYISQYLQKKYQQSPFALIGFSLGGNVAVRYLAQSQNNPYQAACIICAPLQLANCSQRMNQGFAKNYQKYLLQTLKTSTKEKIYHKKITHISQDTLNKITNLYDFDQQVTAPLNGFTSAEDYYQQASGLPLLDKISRPCLLIHANDDPFLDHNDALTTPINNSKLEFAISQHGGHLGFISGNNLFKPNYWLEQRIPTLLGKYL